MTEYVPLTVEVAATPTTAWVAALVRTIVVPGLPTPVKVGVRLLVTFRVGPKPTWLAEASASDGVAGAVVRMLIVVLALSGPVLPATSIWRVA